MPILWPRMYKITVSIFTTKYRFELWVKDGFLMALKSTCQASDLNTGLLKRTQNNFITYGWQDYEGVMFCDFASIKYISTRYVSIGLIKNDEFRQLHTTFWKDLTWFKKEFNFVDWRFCSILFSGIHFLQCIWLASYTKVKMSETSVTHK